VLLLWAKNVTKDYAGVEVTNWTTSWWSGLAYCAILHYYYPDRITFTSLKPENRQQNMELAFRTAEVRSRTFPGHQLTHTVSGHLRSP
jgi:hypothetical protein